jgi:hypothetical protein
MPASAYEVLGVAADVDAAELRRAYLALAQQHHPDRPGGDAGRMRELNEAWARVGDPIRRARYDASLGGAPRPHVSPWTTTPADEADDEHLDLDGRPFGATVALPRWLALLPVGLFALSVLVFVVGVLAGLPAILGLAVMLFASSALLFLAAPFLTLYASRRPNR